MGAIKRKNNDEAKGDHQNKKVAKNGESLVVERQEGNSSNVTETEAKKNTVTGGLQVIGLYQGLYDEHSSDSDSSFSGEEDAVKRDLCGRKIIRKDCEK